MYYVVLGSQAQFQGLDTILYLDWRLIDAFSRLSVCLVATDRSLYHLNDSSGYRSPAHIQT